MLLHTEKPYICAQKKRSSVARRNKIPYETFQVENGRKKRKKKTDRFFKSEEVGSACRDFCCCCFHPGRSKTLLWS